MQALPEDWERAVAVVAHPDDLEYGVASAIARWTRQGKSVVYVLATSGEAGIDGMAPAEAGPLREAEERASAEVVGVREVEFLGHVDGAVEYGLALRRDLAGAFRRHRPEIVITTNFDLTWGESGAVNHADHRAIGLAVLDACRDAANRWLFPELGEPWQATQAVYVAAMNPPTHYVDVGDTLELGIRSLEQHRVYIEGLGRDFDAEQVLTDMAGFAGMAAGCDRAVLFHKFV
jgi:LmbE family N-acetylglucosaminyl deacetylase